jgi:hypothetical protein
MHHLSKLEGKTIRKVSMLTASEITEMMWYSSPEDTTLIEFTDDTAVLVYADPEGNGPGFLEFIGQS